ncbi:hypothetical protein KBX31_03500 [Liquorilactobacillus satsumensis]|nr:hypothetical protein [Liquorilactobacillus satsumensis]MCP9312365.1 hypothetical protein [Liquorilactobacillus satsumensis]MCP9327660.1 hypothetical protein [Liquorilactobacillus satsumensis]MCP9359631.1 hypothetical protein [Liquorilactobacillus satsumensis]
MPFYAAKSLTSISHIWFSSADNSANQSEDKKGKNEKHVKELLTLFLDM